MKILGIIPARGGSKGIPNKNCKLLNKRPLLHYTAKSALNSKYLTAIILSSDSDEIIQIGRNEGLTVPFKRPIEFATDTSPTIDTIIHALHYFEAKGTFFDAVCLLQTTYPFREEGFIDRAIQKFKKSDVDSLISVLEVPHEYNPHWVFTPSENGHLKIVTGEKEIISRRQDLPVSFHRDGAIYLTKTTTILENHSLYGYSIGYIQSDPSNYINLDTMQDWKLAEAMLRKR